MAARDLLGNACRPNSILKKNISENAAQWQLSPWKTCLQNTPLPSHELAPNGGSFSITSTLDLMTNTFWHLSSRNTYL